METYILGSGDCQDSTRPNCSNPPQDKLKPQELQSHLEHCLKVSRKYTQSPASTQISGFQSDAVDCYQAVCKLWKMIDNFVCQDRGAHTRNEGLGYKSQVCDQRTCEKQSKMNMSPNWRNNWRSRKHPKLIRAEYKQLCNKVVS